MVSQTSHSDVAVLGAGIMGCCLALELAQRGYSVDLVDRAPVPVTGASLHNEGKLHLGFVYARDPSGATHALMARGSLTFSRIIQKLTGSAPEALVASQPFHYYVPIDSQLDMAAIEHHFQAVEAAIHQASREEGNSYLGRRLEHCYERNSPSVHRSLFAPTLTLGSFRTDEVSVSPVALAAALCRAVVAQARINFRGGTEVVGVERLAGGEAELETRRGLAVARARYPCVVNCLWEDKLTIDATAGIPDQGPWMLRYKATIEVSAPASARAGIPSATGILGPYGDVVNHGNGRYYVSWYPLCKLAQSIGGDGRHLRDLIHETAVSRWVSRAASHAPAIARLITSVSHREFIQKNISEMAAYVPSLTDLHTAGPRDCVLGGGVILARGATDIDDPSSHLHQRSAIGPRVYGSYVSVDTGKYCTAPMFALEAADLIVGILR